MNRKEHGKAAILGFQHLLAMYAGAVAVPLLIGSGLNLKPAELTYLLSTDIFMCGVATLLQLIVNRFFGIGLPVVLGCAIQTVAPLILIGKNHGTGAMYGAIIASGLFVILISSVFSKIKQLFPPLVTGVVITVIGLSLIPVAIEKMGGGSLQAANFGAPKNIGCSLLTILIILILQIWGRGFIRAISVLLGLVIGTIVSSFLGMVNLSPVAHAQVFRLLQFFYFGKPVFEWSSILLMILISLVSMVESTGVYFALSEITGETITSEKLKKGYRAEGLAAVLGGIFNTFPYTGFSQNVGLVQLSGIKTRKPIYYSAFFLIGLGLLPKFGAVAEMIPDPVLGGGMLAMFGMVATQGMRILSKVDFSDDGNLLVMALSIGIGLGFNLVPTLFQHFPPTLQMFTGNGIVMSSVSAVFLNLLMKLRKKG